MRAILAALAVLCCLGCEEFNEAMETERKPATPPGIASPEDVESVSNAASGGSSQSADGSSAQKQQGSAESGRQAPQTRRQRTGIIGKTTAEVVDMRKAMAENPHLQPVENKVVGKDPFSVAGSTYVSATSRISVNQFKHNLRIWKNLPQNQGRNPTYEEFMDMAKDLRFAKLPPYQMYGYDEKTGRLVILEDTAKKRKLHEEAGIPLEE